MACVITLTGASGCGKSEIIKELKIIRQEERYAGSFQPIMIPKFTTRGFRANELALIEQHREDELDVRPVVGRDNNVLPENGFEITLEDQDEVRRKAFAALDCDLVYEQYGNRYGIRMSEIYECLKKGQSPVIILNDIRAVEDIKTFLGKKCISLYVFRKTPSRMEYQKQESLRKTNEVEAENRFQKAQAIYRIYIENIHIFDKLVLNVQNGTESLRKVLQQLVDNACQPLAFFQGENQV